MSIETEALMDRISKLLAKAKGTNNEHEAAIFAAKAAELLAEHNLTEAMLSARDATREQGPIGRHPFGTRVPDAWRERVVVGCAKLYFCRIVFGVDARDKPLPHTWTFVGREHNAKVAAAMADYLIATVKRMAREYSPITREQRDFRKGAGDRLYERLWAKWREQNTGPATAPSGTTLPALYKAEELALAEYLGDINKIKGRGHKYGENAWDGRAAADRISLDAQVRETRAERMIGRS